ncbi:MAG: DUF2225 domain-containing protein [Carboxydocellales bacterium]
MSKDMSKLGYMQRLPNGTVIFHENDQGAEMYIVLQGSVEISMESNGNKINLAVIGAGGFLGEMTLLEGHNRTATAVTTSDSVLMVITKHNFDEVISSHPDIAMRIMKALSGRIRDLNKRLKETTDQLEVARLLASVKDGKWDETTTAGNPLETGPTEIQSAGEELDLDSENDDHASELVDVEINNDAKVQEFYFYEKEVTCPICSHKLSVQVLKDSKLRQKDHNQELRTIYHDVDPILYNIWVCSQCYFAMPKSSFEKIDGIQATVMANCKPQRLEKFKFDFSGNRTIGFVIEAHKAAIECIDGLGRKRIDLALAELWLRVAWLYDDLHQRGKAKEARKLALAKYKSGYLEDAGSDEKSQKLEYLIGTISASLGNTKEAKDYMFKAVSRRNGHLLIKEIAKDALRLIKETDDAE